jgi:hypothetical protein
MSATTDLHADRRHELRAGAPAPPPSAAGGADKFRDFAASSRPGGSNFADSAATARRRVPPAATPDQDLRGGPLHGSDAARTGHAEYGGVVASPIKEISADQGRIHAV